jgi:hypothetical protein
VGETERKGLGRLAQEGDGAALGLVILDGQVDGAGPAIDGDIEVALAALAIGGLQLGQVLDVDVDEAEIIVPEGALAPDGPLGRGRAPAAQALSPEDAPDAVAVQMRQEVGHYEGEVIEGEFGGPAQRADDDALLLGGLPGQGLGPGRVVEAVFRSALAPLADGLAAHAEAASQDTRGLGGAGDLGPDCRGGTGIRVDLVHGSPPSQNSARQALEAI